MHQIISVNSHVFHIYVPKADIEYVFLCRGTQTRTTHTNTNTNTKAHHKLHIRKAGSGAEARVEMMGGKSPGQKAAGAGVKRGPKGVPAAAAAAAEAAAGKVGQRGMTDCPVFRPTEAQFADFEK